MIRVLQIEVERNTLTLDLQIDKVKTIEVELDRLRVLANLSWSENDWDLKLVLFSWHEDLTWDYREVEIVRLLEISL
jgi:hypothetical protein